MNESAASLAAGLLSLESLLIKTLLYVDETEYLCSHEMGQRKVT